MNWLIFFIVILMVVAPSVSGVDDYRVALASDIESGSLQVTEKAKRFINRGDKFLDDASQDRRLINYTVMSIDNDLFAAFIAKVNYERARLEMEMSE